MISHSDFNFIDCIAENIRDIKDKWGKIRMGPGAKDEKEAAMVLFD